MNTALLADPMRSRQIMVFLGSVLMLRDNGHLGVHAITKRLPLDGKKFCKLLSDLTTLACCALLSVGAWQIIGLNMVNIAPISGIPLGVVYTKVVKVVVEVLFKTGEMK